MATPAPWKLTGRGFILVYRFPKKFVRESCFIAGDWKHLKWSGFGYVMIVDYQDSPVGRYHEFLVIPGKARFAGARRNNISKIYVDSVDSMVNGRHNWGITKELADFTWSEKEGRHLIRIGGGTNWFEIVLEAGRISFPFDTRLLPINLFQEVEGQKFEVSPVAKGRGHFGQLKEIKVDPLYFPEVNLLRPLIVIYVNPFEMIFPVAAIESFYGN